jgi:hypothetical protein
LHFIVSFSFKRILCFEIYWIWDTKIVGPLDLGVFLFGFVLFFQFCDVATLAIIRKRNYWKSGNYDGFFSTYVLCMTQYELVGTWWEQQKFQWSFKLKCEKFARAKHKITAYKVAPTMKALEIIKEFQGIPCHTMYTSSVEATRSCCSQKNKRRQGDGEGKSTSRISMTLDASESIKDSLLCKLQFESSSSIYTKYIYINFLPFS